MGFIIKAYGILMALSLVLIILGFLIHSIFSAPILAIFVVAMVAIMIIGKLVLKNAFSNYSCSASEMAELEEAKKKDAAAKQNNGKSRRLAEAARNESIENYAENARRHIAEIQEKINAQDKIISASIMPAKDRNLSAVDYVIGQMEGMRANSLTEALLQYDDYRDREHQRNLQRLKQMGDEIFENRRREEEQEHRWRMQDLERERLKEAKKAREILEDIKKGY